MGDDGKEKEIEEIQRIMKRAVIKLVVIEEVLKGNK